MPMQLMKWLGDVFLHRWKYFWLFEAEFHLQMNKKLETKSRTKVKQIKNNYLIITLKMSIVLTMLTFRPVITTIYVF